MNKKFAIAFLVCLFAGAYTAVAQSKQAVQQNTPAKDPNGPKFKFKDGDTYNFGTINEGPMAVHEFEFENTGKKPLIIENAMASCGCTTPEWPKEPILPGKTGVITVRFNTWGHVGPFTKNIFISSNAVTESPTYVLHITGTVEASGKKEN